MPETTIPRAEQGRRAKRIVALCLLASAGVLGLLAVLFGAGTFPVLEGSRTILALALGLAAVLDAMLGVKFLLSSSQ